MTENDRRILELQKTVQAKRDALAKTKTKFVPKTNCMLDFEGGKYNLHALSKEDLTLLLVRVNIYLMSAKDLKIDFVVLSGFVLQDWVDDMKDKLKIFETKEAEAELKGWEAKLKNLLSADTKVAQEVDDLAALINA